MNHLKPFTLLPAQSGKCECCAGNHPPHYPHNVEGMFYQYWFYNQHGRWPNWMDALEHCDLEMQLLWLFELEIMGVDVEAGQISPAQESNDGL